MKFQLIDDIQNYWKFWSVRIQLAASTAAGYLMLSPDAAINAWSALPSEMKSFIPENILPKIVIAIFIVGFIARGIKQKKLEDKENAQH